jgi:hypothetical protein
MKSLEKYIMKDNKTLILNNLKKNVYFVRELALKALYLFLNLLAIFESVTIIILIHPNTDDSVCGEVGSLLPLVEISCMTSDSPADPAWKKELQCTCSPNTLN